MEARLRATKEPPRLSFCLEGPAGTGKSAWARHLAQQLGLPVIENPASDLLSMWVGGTEKAIARAFADQWEVGQVNEMLTWIETAGLASDLCGEHRSESI